MGADGGLTLPRLGLGCAALGNLFAPMPERAANELLDTAWGRGVRYFDTAPHYGPAISEQRLGRFLTDLPRHEVLVSTKVGRLVVPAGTPGAESDPMFVVDNGLARVRDYTERGIRQSVEQSLERLGLDYLDLVLVHDPDGYLEVVVAESLPALRQLQHEGLIRAVGVGMNSARALGWIIERSPLDAVICAGEYTLLNRNATTLFESPHIVGTQIIAAGIFNSGILASSTRPGTDTRFNYAQSPGAIAALAAQLWDLCCDFDVPLRAAALAFVTRQHAISSVLIGAASAEELLDLFDCLDLEFPDDLWRRIDAIILNDKP